MYLLSRGPKDLVEFTTSAQQYLIAHKQQLEGKSKTTVQSRRSAQKKSTQSKPDTSQGCQMAQQCYRWQGYGHRQSECATKTSPGKDKKSSTHVCQSSQMKTRAMVAQSSENGEEALIYVNVERTRSKGNLSTSS